MKCDRLHSSTLDEAEHGKICVYFHKHDVLGLTSRLACRLRWVVRYLLLYLPPEGTSARYSLGVCVKSCSTHIAIMALLFSSVGWGVGRPLSFEAVLVTPCRSRWNSTTKWVEGYFDTAAVGVGGNIKSFKFLDGYKSMVAFLVYV